MEPLGASLKRSAEAQKDEAEAISLVLWPSSEGTGKFCSELLAAPCSRENVPVSENEGRESFCMTLRCFQSSSSLSHYSTRRCKS